jgi:hypothetical protein
VLRLPCDLGALVDAVKRAFEAAGLKGEGDGEPRPFPGTASSNSD